MLHPRLCTPSGHAPHLPFEPCHPRSALSTFSMERGIVNRERASKSYHVLVRLLHSSACIAAVGMAATQLSGSMPTAGVTVGR